MKAESQLARDLGVIQERFGYDFVELHMSFTHDLFPFYPPRVTVTRPRLAGFMMGRVTSMETLQLDYWDPILKGGMVHILGQIRDMLQSYGSLDTASHMNDIKRFPEARHALSPQGPSPRAHPLRQGSYSPFEKLLLSLETLSETRPRANDKYELESNWGSAEVFCFCFCVFRGASPNPNPAGRCTSGRLSKRSPPPMPRARTTRPRAKVTATLATPTISTPRYAACSQACS